MHSLETRKGKEEGFSSAFEDQIDDISTLNSDGVFQELARKIYPSSLILNKENVNDMMIFLL